jgi:hypothetical protein
MSWYRRAALNLPPWVFGLAYTLFGLTVLAAFVFYPPRRPVMFTRPGGGPP